MKRFLKIVVLAIFSLFVLIQFYPRPAKNNNPLVTKNDFSVTNTPPASIQNILKRSCYDCHSNNTVYPWYSHIQPVAWWLGDHIFQGKKELNFSEFGTYSLRRKYKKLEEMYGEVKEGVMSLESYTRIHADAIPNANEKELFLNWVDSETKKMESTYPPDSLKKR